MDEKVMSKMIEEILHEDLQSNEIISQVMEELDKNETIPKISDNVNTDKAVTTEIKIDELESKIEKEEINGKLSKI